MKWKSHGGQRALIDDTQLCSCRIKAISVSLLKEKSCSAIIWFFCTLASWRHAHPQISIIFGQQSTMFRKTLLEALIVLQLSVLIIIFIMSNKKKRRTCIVSPIPLLHQAFFDWSMVPSNDEKNVQFSSRTSKLTFSSRKASVQQNYESYQSTPNILLERWNRMHCQYLVFFCQQLKGLSVNFALGNIMESKLQ